MKRSIVNTNFNPNKTPIKIMNGFNLVDKSGVLQKKIFFLVYMKMEYGKNRYHSISEEKKQRLKEYQKNYCKTKRSQYNNNNK